MKSIALAVVGTLLAYLISHEAKAWFPRIIRAIIILAVRRLPKHRRLRFQEEWSAHIDEIPGSALKLWHASGFVFASGRMFPRWRQGLSYRRSRVRGTLAFRITIRALDLIIVIPTLVLVAPTLFFGVILLTLDGYHPLYRQRRIGRAGKQFYIFKLRTFTPCENGPQPYRITRVGRILRRTAVDNVPQLLNILRGDMSFIGPRPSFEATSGFKPGLFRLPNDPISLSLSAPRSIMQGVLNALRLHLRSIARLIAVYW